MLTVRPSRVGMKRTERTDPLVRFWRYVSPEPNSGCWLWTGGIRSGGYGAFHNGHDMEPAHRFSYRIHKAEIPDSLVLDHLCRVRCCVNPDHLEPVTNLENIRRGVNWQKSKTHCKRGHAFTPENTRNERYGARRCRACKNHLAYGFRRFEAVDIERMAS